MIELDQRKQQALTVTRKIENGSTSLRGKAKQLIEEASTKGWLKS